MNALSQRGEPATAPAGATLPKWAVGRRARQPPASAADTNARDSAIVCSIVLQCGADPETIRRALCCDSEGRPSGLEAGWPKGQGSGS
jgi:hypothetical protein